MLEASVDLLYLMKWEVLCIFNMQLKTSPKRIHILAIFYFMAVQCKEVIKCTPIRLSHRNLVLKDFETLH